MFLKYFDSYSNTMGYLISFMDFYFMPLKDLIPRSIKASPDFQSDP